eukprot:1395396-Amorphochlora_amoeboformis.AAC.1
MAVAVELETVDVIVILKVLNVYPGTEGEAYRVLKMLLLDEEQERHDAEDHEGNGAGCYD